MYVLSLKFVSIFKLSLSESRKIFFCLKKEMLKEVTYILCVYKGLE